MLSTNLIAPLEIAKHAFFVVYVLATFGVLVGVYWEGDQFSKEKQHRGWSLLVASLAVDTLFTVLVFGADGWISAIQRSEIIALEKRIAPRNLDEAQRNNLTAALSLFSGRSVKIESYALDLEAAMLGTEIGVALANAHIEAINFLLCDNPLGSLASGLRVTGDDRDLVRVLLEALSKVGLQPSDIPRPQPSLTCGGPNSTTPVAATVFIGVKPINP